MGYALQFAPNPFSNSSKPEEIYNYILSLLFETITLYYTFGMALFSTLK